MMSKIIVGVAVAVISAIIISNLGLNQNQDTYSPPPENPPSNEANWCCDAYRKVCRLDYPVEVGTPCVCYGVYGTGIACQ